MNKAIEQDVDVHALFSPSKLPRIVLCPGSNQLCEGLARKTSTVAQEGTMLHAVTEICLNEGHSEVQPFLVKSYKLTPEHVDAVNEVLDFVSMLRLEHADADDFYESHESKVTLAHYNSEDLVCHELDEVYGTLDYSMMVPSKRLMIVADWKFGKGVEVYPDSEQLKAYALGRLKKRELHENWDTVQVVIVQPRLFSGEKVKHEFFTPSELNSWLEDTLIPALQNAVSREPILNPSDKACMWCDAKRRCHARTAQAVEIAQEVFSQYAVMKEPQLDLKVLSLLMSKFSTLRKYMDDMESFAMGQLLSGKQFPDFKLVRGRSTRKWADEEAAKSWLESEGFDTSELVKVSFYSPSQVETHLGNKIKKNPNFKNFIIKPEGNPTLVPESDKREAIIVESASERFAAFIEEDASDELV